MYSPLFLKQQTGGSMNTLFIVTGSNGAIGNAYFKALLSRKKTVVAVARGHRQHSWPHQQTFDLLDRAACVHSIEQLDFTGTDRIILIHTVGKFHFELTPGECNEEVWQSNVSTFVNIAAPLLVRATNNGITLKLVAFGSPSDPYHVPFWQTFTAAKDAVRKYMRNASTIHRGAQGLFVNISSTRTVNEERLRPFADISKWLTPEEVTRGSIEEIIHEGGEAYQEINIIHPDPHFNNYYADNDAIRRKWMYEMFGKEEE